MSFLRFLNVLNLKYPSKFPIKKIKHKAIIFIMLVNKRKFPRFNFTADVEFNASGSAFSGMTKNISRDGMSFIIENCRAAAGSQLQFQMQNPQREDTIEAYGDIAWKRQMDNEWHLGLRFQFINNVDKSDLLDVAYKNWLSGIHKSSGHLNIKKDIYNKKNQLIRATKGLMIIGAIFIF
jgi:hypothetical protein